MTTRRQLLASSAGLSVYAIVPVEAAEAPARALHARRTLDEIRNAIVNEVVSVPIKWVLRLSTGEELRVPVKFGPAVDGKAAGEYVEIIATETATVLDSFLERAGERLGDIPLSSCSINLGDTIFVPAPSYEMPTLEALTL